jgi:hypothetical protein
MAYFNKYGLRGYRLPTFYFDVKGHMIEPDFG